jgi:1,4-alpha-glucan branching enzyme
MPYKVKGKDIIVLGRNAMVSHQVWSADYGYPGDQYYREFHKDSERSGLKYWRVTDRKNSLDKKLIYDPLQAAVRVKQHARHFINSLDNTSIEAQKLGFRQPMIVACYDTELFGHWWWEGINWLEEVVRLIDKSPEHHFMLPGSITCNLPEAKVFESSWGMGGKHWVWDNEETTWMWDIIREAAAEYEDLDKEKRDSDVTRRVLAQALRELILLESSDWLFMVTNNLTRDYAMKRFFDHYAKFLRLTNAIRDQHFSDSFIEWLDKVQREDDFLLYL